MLYHHRATDTDIEGHATMSFMNMTGDIRGAAEHADNRLLLVMCCERGQHVYDDDATREYV